MIVAFPSQISTLEFQHMFSAFLSDFMHPVSIIFLWVLDVFIVVACLQDGRIRAAVGRWLSWILFALGLFVLLGVIVPHENPDVLATHALGLGFFTLLFIVVARGLSYVASQQGTPI